MNELSTTAAVRAAFADRFTRNAAGTLVFLVTATFVAGLGMGYLLFAR